VARVEQQRVCGDRLERGVAARPLHLGQDVEIGRRGLQLERHRHGDVRREIDHYRFAPGLV
jgi:hypothetical protein